MKTKRGRKSKPFRASNGKTYDGLYRKPDGRWRIVATGYEFRESDEQRAIAKFYQLTGGISDEDRQTAERIEQHSQSEMKRWCKWFADQIYTRPQWLAEQCGVEQLGYLLNLRRPEPIILSDLRAAFEKRGNGCKKNKKDSLTAFDEMVTATSAKTLADLSKPTLVAYADIIRAQPISPGYMKQKFERARKIIKFGMGREFDEKQIADFLLRAKVMTAPPSMKKLKGHPISVENFHKLLNVSDDFWKAVLLMSLNAALYAKEVRDVNWEDIDLDAGTFHAIREKKGLPRAAILWPRTIEALKKIRRQLTGPVFKSSRGTAYHENSLKKIFAEMRELAGVPETVKFENLRDGAYTACCNAGVADNTSKFLMGHKLRGEGDHYAERTPIGVAPACQAIDQKYFAKELKIAAA